MIDAAAMSSIKHSPRASILTVFINAVVCLLLATCAMPRCRASDVIFVARTVIVHGITCSAKYFEGESACINVCTTSGCVASQCSGEETLHFNESNLPRPTLLLSNTSRVTSNSTSSFIRFDLLLPELPRGKVDSLLNFTCEYLSNIRNGTRRALVSRSTMMKLTCCIHHGSTDEARHCAGVGGASSNVPGSNITCQGDRGHEECDDNEIIRDIEILPNQVTYDDEGVNTDGTQAWALSFTSLPRGEQEYKCQVKTRRNWCSKTLTCQVGNYPRNVFSPALLEGKEQNVTTESVTVILSIMLVITFGIGVAVGVCFRRLRERFCCSKQEADSLNNATIDTINDKHDDQNEGDSLV